MSYKQWGDGNTEAAKQARRDLLSIHIEEARKAVDDFKAANNGFYPQAVVITVDGSKAIASAAELLTLLEKHDISKPARASLMKRLILDSKEDCLLMVLFARGVMMSVSFEFSDAVLEMKRKAPNSIIINGIDYEKEGWL